MVQMLRIGEKGSDFQRWLANSTDSWLLIIDNADDPSLDVSRIFPTGNRGTIIVTTRNTGCKIHATVGSSEILELPLEEAVTLLLKASDEKADDSTSRQRARPVVEALYSFTLALIHAGAVIRQGLFTFDEYCNEFKERTRTT